MKTHRSAWAALCVLCVAAWAPGLHAQVRYQCRSASGTVFLSATPCGAPGSNSAPLYYGPTEQARPYMAPAPSIGEAPEYITYMSPRCSGLNDALRTAAARGLDFGTRAEMRRNYQRECAEDEADARAKLAREHGERRQLVRSAQESQTRAQERTKLHQEQCDESKRILVTKRARIDLTEGEKAELQRFEANYKARCS